MILVVLASLLAVAVGPSQDPSQGVAPSATGNWTGEIKTPSSYSPIPLYLKLQQSSAGLAGTGGPGPETQYPLKDATQAGGVLRFAIAAPGVTLTFALTFVEGRLEGDASSLDESGKGWKGKARLTRETGSDKRQDR